MLNLSFRVENAKTYVLRHLLTFIVASIPFPTMGAIYHTIWRHRGTLARRAVNKCFTTRPACLEPRRTAEPSAMRRSATIGETAIQVYIETARSIPSTSQKSRRGSTLASTVGYDDKV